LNADLSQNEVTSIEPLEVARGLVALYDEIEPWAKRTSTASGNAKKVRALFKRASDPAQFTLNDLPNIYGQIDLANAEAVDQLVAKVKDGLVELRSIYKATIIRFREFVLRELGISIASDSNMLELNQRAKSIKGLSGDNHMESFILHISQLSTNWRDFERLGWVVLSKPSKAWIDIDIDRLFIETTKLAREFNSLETMASIKGNKQTKYAFSLLSHNRINSELSHNHTFELSDDEVKEASDFVEALKNVKKSGQIDFNQKSLMAALTLLISEENKDV